MLSSFLVIGLCSVISSFSTEELSDSIVQKKSEALVGVKGLNFALTKYGKPIIDSFGTTYETEGSYIQWEKGVTTDLNGNLIFKHTGKVLSDNLIISKDKKSAYYDNLYNNNGDLLAQGNFGEYVYNQLLIIREHDRSKLGAFSLSGKELLPYQKWESDSLFFDTLYSYQGDSAVVRNIQMFKSYQGRKQNDKYPHLLEIGSREEDRLGVIDIETGEIIIEECTYDELLQFFSSDPYYRYPFKSIMLPSGDSISISSDYFQNNLNYEGLYSIYYFFEDRKKEEYLWVDMNGNVKFFFDASNPNLQRKRFGIFPLQKMLKFEHETSSSTFIFKNYDLRQVSQIETEERIPTENQGIFIKTKDGRMMFWGQNANPNETRFFYPRTARQRIKWSNQVLDKRLER